MNWERPDAEEVAARAVEVAKLTMKKINEDPALPTILGSSEVAVVIGAIIADAIANLDDSLLRIRDAITKDKP